MNVSTIKNSSHELQSRHITGIEHRLGHNCLRGSRRREFRQLRRGGSGINKAKSELHIFDTGNGLANALLSNKSSMLNEGCEIDYSGIIPDSINKVDLCIILSNALDNAVEACNKLPSPGVISVCAANQQGYFVLSIKNPTICSENYYDIPLTTKPDKENHGMGLYNIESTAKKHDGQIKIKCENGYFLLTVTLKM